MVGSGSVIPKYSWAGLGWVKTIYPCRPTSLRDMLWRETESISDLYLVGSAYHKVIRPSRQSWKVEITSTTTGRIDQVHRDANKSVSNVSDTVGIHRGATTFAVTVTRTAIKANNVRRLIGTDESPILAMHEYCAVTDLGIAGGVSSLLPYPFSCLPPLPSSRLPSSSVSYNPFPSSNSPPFPFLPFPMYF